MKIALGTVQLGMPYGIANTHGQPSLDESEKIISLARDRGIDTLDTAMAYGESELRLGQIGVDGFRLITKLSGVPADREDTYDWVFRSVEASLLRLRQSKLDSLLLHRPDQLLDEKGSELYGAILKLKEQALVRKIGVSIYNPGQLDSILTKFSFDIVQSPLNVLDRRISESGWARKLKALGIELHARSVFLQGLLLMTAAQRPPYFHKWADLWHRFDEWIANSGRPAIEMTLGNVIADEYVSLAIVGVENAAQLLQILDAAEHASCANDFLPGSINESLINPACWC